MNISLHPRVFIFFMVGLVWIVLTRHATVDVPIMTDGERIPSVQFVDMQLNAVGTDSINGVPAIYTLWASWCPPCIAEMPILNQLYPELQAQGIRLIAVNQGEGTETIANYLATAPVEFEIWQDPQRQMGLTLRADDLPTTAFVDKRGVVRLLYRGPVTPELVRAMAKVLAE
jgi:cytochrome c biogenesis protein CcmG, thiol:disulfide interchange protein DsbE